MGRLLSDYVARNFGFSKFYRRFSCVNMLFYLILSTFYFPYVLYQPLSYKDMHMTISVNLVSFLFLKRKIKEVKLE